MGCYPGWVVQGLDIVVEADGGGYGAAVGSVSNSGAGGWGVECFLSRERELSGEEGGGGGFYAGGLGGWGVGVWGGGIGIGDSVWGRFCDLYGNLRVWYYRLSDLILQLSVESRQN